MFEWPKVNSPSPPPVRLASSADIPRKKVEKPVAKQVEQVKTEKVSDSEELDIEEIKLSDVNSFVIDLEKKKIVSMKLEF